ncbi:hypothetical protein FNV43_RR00390 [Rhamnella rubrinervis]|uniref:Transmembrane protein n=1 Tax=Rhamnella rubrinervis TaxID=2594499 RepID=A0A8K0HPG6_9ROSA|nr:hypothetical protein FNV43_RR00390 [Rhamnella rubrinervis]
MGSINGSPLLLSLSFMVIILAWRIPGISGQTNSTSSSVPVGSNLFQDNNASDPVSNQSDDTIRVDPLDNFKKYKGGFDITNKHYWSSTIFSGIYGYAIGALWLLCGMLYGGFLLATSCFSFKTRKIEAHKKSSTCYRHCYLWPILPAILLTFLAIVASGLVIGGNERFHSHAKTVVNIIIDTANEASESIYNTTGAMKEIRDNLGDFGAINNEAADFLTSTSRKLDVEAADIQKQARKNRRLIDKSLKIVYIITITTISLNLAAVIVLSVSGILRLQRLLRLFIVLCWFLTVLCWLFFGMYFFLDKFSGDTCTAFENFQQNPENNSLSSILPCDELNSAKSVLYDVSAGIYRLVNEVNANISLLRATSSYANIVDVCNPFSEPPEYQYQQENCPSNTIRIGDIPKVLKVFSCSENATSCETGAFFISNSNYKMVEAYTSSIQNLVNAYPVMESLVECESVKNAFSEILTKQCKPLKRFVKMVWAAMLFLSLTMVFLVVLWTIRDRRYHTNHFSDGSVRPHSAPTDMVELHTVNKAKNNPNQILV